MRDDTYNGWSNRATWLVALHLNNDQGLQQEALDLAERVYCASVGEADADLLDTPERVDRYAVSFAANSLEGFVRELATPNVPNQHATVQELIATDLVSTVLSQVGWHEVAEAFLEDVERVTDQEVPA